MNTASRRTASGRFQKMRSAQPRSLLLVDRLRAVVCCYRKGRHTAPTWDENGRSSRGSGPRHPCIGLLRTVTKMRCATSGADASRHPNCLVGTAPCRESSCGQSVSCPHGYVLRLPAPFAKPIMSLSQTKQETSNKVGFLSIPLWSHPEKGIEKGTHPADSLVKPAGLGCLVLICCFSVFFSLKPGSGTT